MEALEALLAERLGEAFVALGPLKQTLYSSIAVGGICEPGVQVARRGVDFEAGGKQL